MGRARYAGTQRCCWGGKNVPIEIARHIMATFGQNSKLYDRCALRRFYLVGSCLGCGNMVADRKWRELDLRERVDRLSDQQLLLVLAEAVGRGIIPLRQHQSRSSTPFVFQGPVDETSQQVTPSKQADSGRSRPTVRRSAPRRYS